MAKKKNLEILKTDLLVHTVINAWSKLYPRSGKPKQIEVLKQKSQGAVYRLIGIGPRNKNIIAKRIRHERAVIERPVYEEVLPHLPVPTIQYYGCVEEDDRFWWIFLEDVGNERFSPFVEQHLTLAARWLGTMHTAAESLKVKTCLPERGPDHYLMYLRSARKAIPKIRQFSSLMFADQTTLQNIISMCVYLEAKWSQIENFSDQIPRTFIHGDCLVKNVHIRTTEDGLTIAPFDWGGAGWGLPATDLGQLGLPYHHLPLTDPDCATYLSVVQDHWPHINLQMVEQLANLGQMFWSLKVISRSIPEFEYKKADIRTIMDKFSVYKTVLAKTIRAIRWEN